MDPATYFLSIVGICFGVVFFGLRSSLDKKKIEYPDLTQNILISIRDYENALDTILKDYEITNKEIERRENINLLVGTILVTASLLILGNTANASTGQIFPYALSSIVLFVLWLFVLHYTTAKMDSFGYARMRAIEEALTQQYGYDFGIHRFNYAKIAPKDKFEFWAEIRRYFWGIIMIAFSLSWAIISVLKP